MTTKPLNAPVYASAAELGQYPGPLTVARYAIVDGIGLFRWYASDLAEADGATTIAPSGGSIGRWRLAIPFQAATWKPSVYAVSSSDVTSLSGAITTDSVSVPNGETVLLVAQATTAQNGPWVVNTTGAWSRPTWFDSTVDCVPGMVIAVKAGAASGGTIWMVSDPLVGTITPGTTPLTLERISGNLPKIEQFNETITLDEFATQTYSGSSVVALSLATTGHASGVTKILLIPAYTATSVYFSPDLNQSGSAFDERYDYEVRVSYANSRASTTTKTIQRPDTVRPDLLYAYVPTADPDTLVLVFSQTVKYTDLTGVSLSFTSGTPKTIASIRGGKGTTSVRLKLSGAIQSSDVFSVVFGSGNNFRDMSENGLAAVTMGVRWYTSPADLSGLAWWEAGNYDESSGQWPAAHNAASHLIQQVTAAKRPSDVANGYDGATVLRFASKSFTADAGTDVVTVAAGHSFVTDDVVNVRSEGGALPGGLSASTAYYVRDATATTFKLAAAPAGAAIDITSNGSGTLTIGYAALASTDALSAYVSASTALMWAVTVPTRITTNGGLPQQNEAVIGHGYLGIHARVTGADAWSAHAYNFDGVNFDGYDTGKSIQLQTPMLGRLRHEGGNLYFRRDNAAESAAETSGNTNVVSGSVVIGAGTTATNFMDQDLMAIGFRATAPGAHELAGLNTFVMTRPFGGFMVPRLRLPERLFAIAGDTVRIYWEDVLLLGDMSSVTFSTSGTSGSTTNNTLWSWAPGAAGSYTLSVVVSDVVTGLPVAAGSVPITVAAAAGTGTVRYLQIGDSLTAGVGAAMSDRVRAVCSADGMTVTMLGTKGGRNFTASSSAGLLITATGHGYVADDPVDFHPEPGSTLPGNLSQGTQYYWLAADANTGRVSLTPGGAAVAYADGGTGSFYVRHTTRERHEGRAGWSAAHFRTTGNGGTASPFVYYDGVITTSTDGALDLDQYTTDNLGGSDPTHVLHELGINDLLSQANADDPADVEDAVDSFITHLERLIAAERTAWPSAKIAVATIPPPNARQSYFDSDYPTGQNRWQWKRIQHRARERTLWQFRGREASGIYVVDLPVIDPDPTTGDYATSAVHPITQGSQRIGDQFAAWVRCNP